MRIYLCLASYAVVAALLLTAAAPGGLSLCVQQTGKASIGLGCTCQDCADQQTAADAMSGPRCCERCDLGVVLHSHCCTCSKLPAVASAIKVHHDLRVRPASTPALRPPAIMAEVQSAGISWQQNLTALDLPPPSFSHTVLRL